MFVSHVFHVLEAEGFSVQMKNIHSTSLAGEVPPDESMAQIWVAGKDYEKALEVVNDLTKHGVLEEGGQTCPQCGEFIESQFAQCWQCGQMLSD